MSKAILLSGGMDSIALAYWKRPQYAFTINYGQKPAIAEINAASEVCRALNINHQVITIDCSSLGSGDLSSNNSLQLSPSTEWWPYRNQLLVTLACMKGISLNINELMVGSLKTDGFHMDGTSSFYTRLDELVSLQEGNIRITCPSINLTGVELITESRIPKDILLWAHSCHTSNYPCGRCNGCNKYLYIIQQLGYE